MNKKIVIATGGTGGHVFPALALKKYLEDNNFTVIVTGDSKFSRYHPFDDKHLLIPAAHFASRHPFSIIKSLFILAQGFLKSLVIIYKEDPKIVIGFGGYATYPILLAACILKKDIIVHEANTTIGKVNRLFLKHAKYLTTGFKKIFGIDEKYNDKVVYTGNPVRENIKPSDNKANNKNFNILIIGGSQGAKVFSKVIPEMIINLPKEDKENLFLCQQVKEEDITTITAFYKREKIECEIKSFFDDMDKKLANANLVIARAGASTISELVKVGVPAVFIPYPYAADNHQFFNAKEIVDSKAGWVVEESNNTYIELLQIIKSILKDPSILVDYSNHLKEMDRDGCANILKLL